jgi:hypothetical protein
MSMISHPTPTCFDDGGSGKCGYGRLLSERVHQNCSDSVMTEEQRLLYNIQQLGAAGAIEFELQFQKVNARMTPEAREERRRLKSAAQLARNAAARNKIVAK